MTSLQSTSYDRGIAIIGMSGRYPGGADNPSLLWQNLKAGVDAVTEARGDRWDLGHHHPDPERPDRVYTRACGVLESIDGFDNEFFGLSPREARQVDPQQRLLLELAWEALEDAALPLDKVAGSDTGVFIGISSNDYANLVGPGGPDAYSNTGASFSIAANRISYFLDLHGPSIALDTACSSTIVGLHQAVESLHRGDCSMALVGGISLLVHIRPWIGFAKASMLSPTGRCKSFDASGDGYVRSEGGGIVVLKPLAAAERDGDSIYGVILGSGVNSDGHTLGLSMPNPAAQESLLRKVYAACGVAPEDVVYVEAHGTGTAVGDPIECESIGKVLGAPRADGSRLLIGSVKSNIGHLEAASGMAGLAKALLVLRNGEIPGNLHFETPNPKIEFEAWKLRVVTETTPLPLRERPVVIGVNSFGFGGTNAHVAISEYRKPVKHANGKAHRNGSPASSMLVLSAHTPAALRAVAASYVAFLRDTPASQWKDVCAATALCRSMLRYRLALVAASPAEAVERLERYLADELPARLATGSSGTTGVPVAFVYSGNGPQWWGMGRELMESEPEFRETIEAIDAAFAPIAGWSIVEEMRRPEADSRMALTEYAQPTLFALQAGLTALLRTAGITPAVTLGHSVGEVAAAYVSGALTLADATRVIYNRSLHQARTAGMGTMAAVGISAAEAHAAIAEIPGWLEVAASNAPKAATVAGSPDALERLRASLTEAGKFARVLPLQYAFHTKAMDGIKDDLIASLEGLEPGACTIPFMSTVDAVELGGAELGPEYWWRNVREPVRFYEAVDALLARSEIGVFLEIGPHPVLRDYVAQCAKAREKNTASLGTLRRPSANRAEPEADNLWNSICACYANGAGSPSSQFARPHHVPALPSYPWQRSRHWRGTTQLPDVHLPITRVHPLLGYFVSGIDGLWENTLDTNQLTYLADHVVQGSVVFPAAGYIEAALAAARIAFGADTLDLESAEILRPLTIPAHADPLMQSAADLKDGTFKITSRPDKHMGNWTQHFQGRIGRSEERRPERSFDAEALKATLPCYVSGADHYAVSAARGLAYGPAFQGITGIWMTPPDAARQEALAEIDLGSLAGDALAPYVAHPSLSDSAFQVILSLLGRSEARPYSIIPVFVERIRSYAALPSHFFCSARIVRESERSAVADFDLFDLDGKLLISFRGTRCQKVDFTRGSASSLIAEWWRPDPAWANLFPVRVALPAPAAIASALGTPVDAAIESFERAGYYQEIQARLDGLAGAYVARALRELGAADGPFTLARLAKRGRVRQEREALLAALVAIAESGGTIVASGDAWVWNDAQESEAPETLWQRLASAQPRLITELMLASRAGDALVATLREEVTGDAAAGLDALFDGATFSAVYHRIARDAIASLVTAWPKDRPIRVLEIGGAGGGLTAAILGALPAERTDYVFTDIAEAALGRAEHRFARYPFVRVAALDIVTAPDAADVAPESFDIVVAGNVLHAVTDRDAALANVFALLAPGGTLVALEHEPCAFSTLVLGTPADATAADTAWPESFESAGFEDTAALSDASVAGGNQVQTLYLARKPLTAETLASASPSTLEPHRWLVLAERAERESALLAAARERLISLGHTVTVHELGEDADLEVDAVRAAIDASAATSVLAFARSGQRGTIDAVRIVQAVDADRERTPQITFVTRGALASPFEGPRTPWHAPVWGLARVASNEYPTFGIRLIDVHADLGDAAGGAWLAEALVRRDDETEVQLCGGMRYVNRERMTSLVELGDLAKTPQPEPEAFRLDFVPQGGLDSLHLRAIERRKPGANDVEIRVHAAGLNFRDVLWAMGVLPEEAVEQGFSGPTIGMECAGEIVRVGAGVRDLKAGDRVVAFASSCFASHVTTDAGSVIAIPESLGYEEAATIPIAFLTAYYALDELARIAPGETVLVHGAAGGVGLAAVQIAKAKGAIVIGTAGSPAKRRMLEMVGADHVLNSRTLEFADDVMAITHGKGVDVVLNSLAGEAITKGLQVLRPFGRFLEIGKRDLYANSRIGLRPFRQNLSYFGIDADTLLIERPELARRIFKAVIGLFASGDLHPLPFVAVPIARASEAFRSMQQSKHVGKIVVALPDEIAEQRSILRSTVPVRADATYLVTGGLGGFGLSTAQWLVAAGARSVALMGRRGAVTEEALAGILAMERAGATVRTFAADVSDPAAVEATIAAIRREMVPLRGVIHSAAVIEDAPVMNITSDLVARVLEPKARGAWNLHQATLDDELDLFVLYSSVSVMVGNPGQGAYVAANLFLESLAQHRRALGLPALAAGWGAIKDSGFLVRNTAVADMLKHRSGLDATPAAEALAELGRLTAAGAERVCIARYNLQRLGQMLAGARVPRFKPLIPKGLVTEGEATETLADRLKVAPAAERRGMIVTQICAHAGRVLGTSGSSLDVERPLAEMGLDSLMAVELAEAVERDVAQPVSVMQMLGAGTIGAIADLVLATLGLAEEGDAPPPERAPAAPADGATNGHAHAENGAARAPEADKELAGASS
jgi:acyl transferase domain-containing protein/aryl carrier-like protein